MRTDAVIAALYLDRWEEFNGRVACVGWTARAVRERGEIVLYVRGYPTMSGRGSEADFLADPMQDRIRGAVAWACAMDYSIPPEQVNRVLAELVFPVLS